MCTLSLDDILDEGSKFQYSMFISFPQFIYCSHDEVIFPKLSCLIAADGGTLHSKWAPFSCLRLRQWPVTYLITLSDWIMSCQPGRHAVVTVCEPDWKHKWAAYKSFGETSSFNNL